MKKLWVLVLFFAGAALSVPQMAVAQTAPTVLTAGRKATVTCPSCSDIRIVVRRPPLIKVDLGLSAGIFGAGTKHYVGGGTVDLGVELRLASWVGAYVNGTFGVTDGLLEGNVGSVWSAIVGPAFWPTSWCRIVVAAGYEGLRNPSWNFSFGAPIGSVKADFLVWNGLAFGVTAAYGPGWAWWGDLASLWHVTGGIRYVFGGPRR